MFALIAISGFCSGRVLSHSVLWLCRDCGSHVVRLPALVVQVQSQLGTSLVHIRWAYYFLAVVSVETHKMYLLCKSMDCCLLSGAVNVCKEHLCLTQHILWICWLLYCLARASLFCRAPGQDRYWSLALLDCTVPASCMHSVFHSTRHVLTWLQYAF